MSDFLAVTLGNTSVAVASVTGDGVLGEVCRAPLARLDEVLAKSVAGPVGRGVPVIVASVNPPALQRLRAAAAPQVAGVDFPIAVHAEVDEPERVGVDRLLAALAAHQRTCGPCIVVDFGTAITVNPVRHDGALMGGAILPGLALMARALAQGTAALPEVRLDETPPPIGANTEQAIAAGLVHGAAAAVARLIDAARDTVGIPARVILTGGDAARIAPLLAPDCRDVRPNLVLEGLVTAYLEREE
ncbi:MAG TPA: type III pantothenate kinase [Phycisphaerae bacterium]|nr:type III pantothenate kinase [Phycisphaerae bacterium]